MNYAEYLQSSHWKLFSASARKYYKTCYVCGTSKNLHVHHLTYWKNGESILHKEKLSDVRLLCARHHKRGQIGLTELDRMRSAYSTRRYVKLALTLLKHQFNTVFKKLISLLFRTK